MRLTIVRAGNVICPEEDFDTVGKIFAEENKFQADQVPEIIQVTDEICVEMTDE